MKGLHLDIAAPGPGYRLQKAQDGLCPKMHSRLFTPITPALQHQHLRSAHLVGYGSIQRPVQCAITPGGPPPVSDREAQRSPSAKPVAAVDPQRSVGARLSQACKDQWAHLMAEVMPQERGDARDWALMYTSVAVFVFMAMQLFRVYAYWYYAAGLRPIMQTFH